MGGPHPAFPQTIEGQTYCLRWNNHKSNLVEILDALIKVESYVDCTIVVDDQIQFKAHRVVLAANSPYFQAILQDVPMDHCSIIFPGVKAFEMRALLDYMYTGEVNVTQSQIPTIMRIAEELEVKGLFDMADLKEKFNKFSEECTERPSHGYQYPSTSTSSLAVPYAIAAESCIATGLPTVVHNGTKDRDVDLPIPQPHHNSSAVISTSSNISASAATSSTASPPYSNYKSQYSNIYSKAPGLSNYTETSGNVNIGQTNATTTPQTPKHSHTQPVSTERNQWPLSPSAAVSMLSSVYDSVPDNPLKRKKLSSMTSMLMNRDTPILRTVLAQANSADSSQPTPFSLPISSKPEKTKAEKSLHHIGHNSNHGQNYNGADLSGEKKYQDEPHSPYTDRSYDDDVYEGKGNYGAGFSSNPNQKPEWKRYKQYTRSDIMSAIQCVREGMSALQASRKFGVPSRTLYDKVKKLGITTGRPMNRTVKRSPSSMEPSAFSYQHGYSTEPLLTTMSEIRNDDHESKDHHRTDQHHIPQLPHSLLDHALLQQALESQGGDIAGRGALLLAAAAHAAANHISSSPGPNGSSSMRSPSPPNYGRKYGRESEGHFSMEAERESERDCSRDHNNDRGRDHIHRLMEKDLGQELKMVAENEEIHKEKDSDHDIERKYERNLMREFERQHELDTVKDRERDYNHGNRRHFHENEESSGHIEDLSVTRRNHLSPPIEAPRKNVRSQSYSPPPPPLHATATITSPIECSNNGVIKLATAAAVSADPNESSRCSSRSSNVLTVADNNSIDDYNNPSTSVLETTATKAIPTIKHEIIRGDDGRMD